MYLNTPYKTIDWKKENHILVNSLVDFKENSEFHIGIRCSTETKYFSFERNRRAKLIEVEIDLFKSSVYINLLCASAVH